MKKLFFKGLIGVLIATIIMYCLISLSMVRKYNIYDKVNLLTDSAKYTGFGTEEVDSVMDIVSTYNYLDKVILGDSVAAQLFSNNERQCDDFYVATGNQSMTFIMQYALIKKYLAGHPLTTDVYMTITYDSLTSVIQPKLSYQYLVMPLVEYGLYDELDAISVNLLTDVYGRFLLNNKVVSTINKSGILRKLCMYYIDNKYSNTSDNKDPEMVSYIPETYLMKIYKLCEENGVRFHLIPCPAKDTPENRRIINNLEINYLNTEIGKLYPDYFKGIVYYPENQFKDALHFKDELLTDEYKEEIINSMKSAIPDFE